VVFDKTGTLTEGNFDVVNELWLHDKVTLSQKSKWDLVVAVQARSTHPIAAALVRYASGG
jgi:cation transport ATPase